MALTSASTTAPHGVLYRRQIAARTITATPPLVLAKLGVGSVPTTANMKEDYTTDASTELHTPDIKLDLLGKNVFSNSGELNKMMVREPKQEVGVGGGSGASLPSPGCTYYVDMSPSTQEVVSQDNETEMEETDNEGDWGSNIDSILTNNLPQSVVDAIVNIAFNTQGEPMIGQHHSAASGPLLSEAAVGHTARTSLLTQKINHTELPVSLSPPSFGMECDIDFELFNLVKEVELPSQEQMVKQEQQMEQMTDLDLQLGREPGPIFPTSEVEGQDLINQALCDCNILGEEIDALPPSLFDVEMGPMKEEACTPITTAFSDILSIVLTDPNHSTHPASGYPSILAPQTASPTLQTVGPQTAFPAPQTVLVGPQTILPTLPVVFPGPTASVAVTQAPIQTKILHETHQPSDGSAKFAPQECLAAMGVGLERDTQPSAGVPSVVQLGSGEVTHPYQLAGVPSRSQAGVGPVRVRRQRAIRKPSRLRGDFLLDEDSTQSTEGEMAVDSTKDHSTSIPTTSSNTLYSYDLPSWSLENKSPPRVPSTNSRRQRGGVHASTKDLTYEEKYRRTRMLNNEASKRCRERRKGDMSLLKIEAQKLKQQNEELRQKVEVLSTRRDRFRALFNMFTKSLYPFKPDPE